MLGRKTLRETVVGGRRITKFVGDLGLSVGNKMTVCVVVDGFSVIGNTEV